MKVVKEWTTKYLMNLIQKFAIEVLNQSQLAKSNDLCIFNFEEIRPFIKSLKKLKSTILNYSKIQDNISFDKKEESE